MTRRRRIGSWPALVAAACAFGALPASAQTDRAFRERTVYEDLQMFSQVLNQIRVNHPDSLSSHALFMAAIEGMIRAADPHSYVIPRERLAPEKEAQFRAGRLVPIPVAFRMVGGAHVVVGVHPGSDAIDLDILPGDELVSVDGQPVRAGSSAELDILLAGPRASTVDLRFERRRADGSIATLERAVRRERVAPESAVAAAALLEPGVGYVRITTFANDRVAADLQRELRTLERAGMRRLVLDLRDNGGGLLDEAAAIASVFLPRGAIVYTTEGRKREMVDTARVRRALWESGRDYPVVVLVNEGTASASELVAGALQDHDRALLVGRPTFGKALVSQGFPLTDGSLMVLVIGIVRTPCGRSVQREYRGLTTREYYRAGAADRDRAGRPGCTTAGGRTVLGGGGIYPDVLLEPAPTPAWLARVQEHHLLVQWMPGYLEEHGPALRALLEAGTGLPLPAPAALPGDPIRHLREFAVAQGVAIPDGDEVDARLAEVVTRRATFILMGSGGYYRLMASGDPEVRAAIAALDQAAELLHR